MTIFAENLFNMEKQLKDRGSVICLEWLNKGEMDAERYEFYTSAAALYSKYTSGVLGITKPSLLNVFSKNNDREVIIYTPPRNPSVRFIKTTIWGKNSQEKEKL